MDRKKVCHISTAHMNNDIRIFEKECVSLSKAGYEVYLVCQGESGVKDGVKLISLPPSKNRMDRMLHGTIRAYRAALIIDADIYHIHDPELLPIAIKLYRKGKKVIFDSHEFYRMQILSKEYIPKILRKIISFIYAKYETHVCKNINAVIFPCLLNGRNVFEGRSKQNVMINNVPKLEDFYEYYDENDYPKAMVRDKKRICYTGSLSHERGIGFLIKAAQLANVDLVLAGRFSSPDFEKYVKDFLISNQVDYRGVCNKEQVRQIYKECVIGCCTLLNEIQYGMVDNLATKVYEYMSLGIPVIISKTAFNQRLLNEYEFGISVNPDNVEEISDAIEYLIASPNEAKKMGLNGRKLIKEMFNWELESEKLLSLYSSI
ncbi:glycosyltransferase family 4 protein [Bacilliculturomica massiliensis]|uniref:glycosyltransferase family 4 protein n=1 Tax=Bacilliculturomica massiliensis TaxID=1917867 RepID=UPI00103028CA|nr:glycosyltransferase family 4 protein [Bacilliculturomica massiliensis]